MFSFLIDVILLGGVFVLLTKYQTQLLKGISKIKLPAMILALIVGVILITYEEHINCGAYGCTRVIFPPTLEFLIIEMFVFFLLFKLFRIRTVKTQATIYSVYGIFQELVYGAGKTQLYALFLSNILIFILIILWVGFSYLFVIYLPLQILAYKKIKAG